MRRLTNWLAKSAFGIGCAIGVLLGPSVVPALESRAMAAAPAPMLVEDDPTPQVWLEGWGIAYEEGFHGMSMAPTNGAWVVTLHDTRAPMQPIGVGTFVETLRVEPAAMEASAGKAAAAGFNSVRAYFAVGVLSAPNAWQTPLSVIVIEAEAPNMGGPGALTIQSFGIRALAASVEEAEQDLLAFTDSAFGAPAALNSGLPPVVGPLSANTAACIADCAEDLADDLKDAQDALNADLQACMDDFLFNAAGCAVTALVCGIWYGLCLGACLSAVAIMYSRCEGRAEDEYNRAEENAYEKYDDCLEACGVVVVPD